MLNNRKFERGKQSKKDAEALNEENERLYTAYLQSEEGQKTEAMLQEYKAKRGPSLMESHLENNSKKKRNESSEYQFFDRDRVSNICYNYLFLYFFIHYLKYITNTINSFYYLIRICYHIEKWINIKLIN